MINNNQSEEVERIVGEFKHKTNYDNYLIDERRNLQGDHLFDSTQYPESQYELDADKIEEWLKKTLTTHGASEYARGKSEERERIIKAIRADKNENAENGGEWANGYNAGKFISVNCALPQENTLKE